MYISLVILFALAIATSHSCITGTKGCDHPGNFTGALAAFQNPASAYCHQGNQTFIYANIPSAFYNPRDESPCDAPINVTHPSTHKTIEAIVIGNCTACTHDSIQLTHAGLAALAPNGHVQRAPGTVKWTFR